VNQRLLARNVPPPGPARAALVQALAAVLPETSAELESHLSGETPWLVDLASVEEAERLRAWVEATSPVRLSIAPAVGPKPPSRGAALAFLEGKLAEERARVSQAAAEEQRRRQEAARERARSLAERESPTTSRPDLLAFRGGPSRPDLAPVRGASPGTPSRPDLTPARVGDRATSPGTPSRPDLAPARVGDRATSPGTPSRPDLTPARIGARPTPPPALDIDPTPAAVRVEPERRRWLAPVVALGVLAVVGALLYGRFSHTVAAGDLEHAIAGALSEATAWRTVDAPTARGRVEYALRAEGQDPARFQTRVYVEPDEAAVRREQAAGRPARTPEAGARIRIRCTDGELHLFVDLALDLPGVPVAPSTDDGPLLDGP
jgi:hypothetical protein